MKIRYAREHNVKYDLVIRTRTDIAYPGKLKKYYKRHKEDFYQSLVKKKGIHTPNIRLRLFDSPDYVYELSHLEVDNAGITSIGYKHPQFFNYCDTVFNDSGVPSHMCQLHLKDWVMYADDAVSYTHLTLPTICSV